MQTTLEEHTSKLIDHTSDINNTLSNITDIYGITDAHDSRLDSVEDLSNSNNTLILNEINNRTDADEQIVNSLASTSLGEGAYLIGVHDSTNNFSSTTVEGILHEIAGEDRGAEHTIKGNHDIIQNNINLYDSLNDDVQFMKDGDDSSWTQIRAANNRWNIADLRTDVNSNDTDISTLQTDLTQEITDRTNADTAIRDDLASTNTGQGASLIGIEDTNDMFTHETVEGVLNELAGNGRDHQTIKSNHNEILSNDTDISNIQSDITSINTELLEIGKIKDGDNGSTWTIDLNLVSLDSRIDTNTSNISVNASNISTNATDIDDNSSFIATVRTDLNDEITNRETADTAIRNNLASTGGGKGASLIGINDVDGNFTSTTVEGALGEIDGKLQTLQNSLSWQEPVATTADLPTEDNTDGDARTVLDDGDGFAAQYVWNDTSWVKIADINWGAATDLSFDNTTSQIESTNVQDAILEVYERAQDPTKAEDNVEANSFSTDGGRFFYDIDHELGTEDVTVLPTSNVDGRVVGVDEVEIVDLNTTRVWVTDDSEGLNFTVFGSLSNYAKVVGSWTESNSMYYHTINHGLNTSKLLYSIFDMDSGKKINLDEVVFTNDNTVTLWASINTFELNIFLLRKTNSTKIKDVDNWHIENGMHIARIKMPEDYDAIYSFIDSNGKAVEVDELWFENGYLKISSTSDEKLRLVILK